MVLNVYVPEGEVPNLGLGIPWDIVTGIIAPGERYYRAVGAGAAGISIGNQGYFIGKFGKLPVCNFSCPVMRGISRLL